MYSLSDRRLRLRLISTALVFLTVTVAVAQNGINLTVNVLPPFTSKLSDYFNTPGRIVSVITTPHLIDTREYKFYLRGYIESVGDDGAIRIGTREDFVPSVPGTVKAILDADGLPISWPPYTVTYRDYQQAFSQQNLVYRGITPQQVAEKGLPDGFYRFCFYIYVDLFGDGYRFDGPFCSPPFNIASSLTAVEPPVIIHPQNKAELTPEQMQSLVFTWTTPPGASAGTVYKLRIIEVTDPGSNYRDMLRSDSYAPYFETTVSGIPTYLYSVANPALKPGKTYAFVVRATDPLGKTNYKNGGFSEVSTFSSPMKVMSGQSPPVPPLPSAPLFTAPVGKPAPVARPSGITTITPAVILPAIIKGKLSYRIGTEKHVMPKAKIKLVTRYIVKHADGRLNEEMTLRQNEWLNGRYKNGVDIATATTDMNGEFTFKFMASSGSGSLGNVDCNPVVPRVADLMFPTLPVWDSRAADISHAGIISGPNVDAPPDEELFPADGDCELYLAYQIVIEGEHAGYYLDPDHSLNYFFEIKGGETKDVGEVITRVRTINLDVTVRSKVESFTIQSKEELEGMDVYVYRKINFNYPVVFPMDDVTPDKTDNFPAPKSNGMVCVGKASTDSEGIARLKLLVLNNNPAYQYYLYVNSPKDYTYETSAPVLLNFKELIDKGGNQQASGGTLINTRNYNALLNERSARGWKEESYQHTIQLLHRFPALRIILEESEGLKKVNQAQVILREEYKKGNEKWSSNSTARYLGQDEINYIPLAWRDTGIFELRDASIEVSLQDKTLRGPVRKVTVRSPGFADTTFLVKSGNPLKMGEKFEMKITLRYGAVLTGKVIDRSTNKPLANATVKVIGEMEKVSTTGNDGIYYLEARRTNSIRRVEITKTGYLTDTVNIRLDKDKNIYNFELFPQARMLNIEVWAGNGLKEGALVTLPDVPESWRVDGSSAGFPAAVQGSVKRIATFPVGDALPATTYQSANTTISAGTVYAGMLQLIPVLQGSRQQSSAAGKGIIDKVNVTLSNGLTLSGSEPTDRGKMTLAEGANTCTEITDKDGYAGFYFKGGQSDRFRLIITNDPNSPDNYPAIITEVNVPYEKSVMGSSYRFIMSAGGCLSGTVYLGEGNASPLGGIDVKAIIPGQAEEYSIQVKTDASGRYELRNLPVNQPFKLIVSSNKKGNNYIGYLNEKYILTTAGSTCKNEDFHMKSVNGVDVASFMGFPFAPSGFEEIAGGRVLLSGTITLTGNKYFGRQEIEVKNVEMVRSNVTTDNGDIILIPSRLPFVADINNLSVSIPGNYKAIISDASGLKIDLTEQDRPDGIVKAGVRISEAPGGSGLSGNFGGTGYTLPDLWLASKPGATDSEIIVYNSTGQVSAGIAGTDRFYITDGKNESPVFSVTGFVNKAFVQSDKSFFDKNGLTLQTKLKADIPNLNPSDLEIDAGAINISRQGLKTVSQKPFTVQLGTWTLTCNNWSLTDEGLTVADATLTAGADIRVENLRFTSQALMTDKANIHLDKMKLLGIKDLIVTTARKGLVYKYLHDGVSGWSIYAVPDYGQTVVATLQGMPGLAPSDRIEFIAVDFNSEGESLLVLNSRKFRLFNLVDFTPYPSTQMYVSPASLKLKGTYDFGIPGYERPSGAMAYIREGNGIAFSLMDMDAFMFTHHNVRYNLTRSYELTNGLFTARGTIEEPGHLPVLNVTMTHRIGETRVDIDKGQSLAMGSGKELASLAGGIRVVGKAWDVLRFDGDLKGFSNINSGQKMNFEVRGAVQATGQQISVSDIPSFPGLTITYDMANSRFLGTASLDMNLAGLKLDGSVNTVIDSKGWLFNATGMIDIPGLGGANLFGLFGNYQGIPDDVSSRIGNAVCLPAGFKTNIHGFFLTAGLTKQILPRVHYDYGIVAIDAGIDVSVNARTFMTFGQGTTFGMGVLAEGHAYLGGSCPVTCTSARADAKLQFGVSGDYNTKTKVFNIDGCSSLNLVISASQCLPVLIDCGPCISVDLADFTIGAIVHLDNVRGFSMGITTQSCDQQCK